MKPGQFPFDVRDYSSNHKAEQMTLEVEEIVGRYHDSQRNSYGAFQMLCCYIFVGALVFWMLTN